MVNLSPDIGPSHSLTSKELIEKKIIEKIRFIRPRIAYFYFKDVAFVWNTVYIIVIY